MVKTKQKLKFFLVADRIMNGRPPYRCLKATLSEIVFTDYIMNYLSALRHCEYYANRGGHSPFRILSEYRLRRLGIKLGFSIARNVFDYGLVIPHYGTIVVGAGNSIGRYAVLHTATCITAGAKVLKNVKIADNVSVGCNAVIYENVKDPRVLVAGNPAQPIKKSEAWYI